MAHQLLNSENSCGENGAYEGKKQSRWRKKSQNNELKNAKMLQRCVELRAGGSLTREVFQQRLKDGLEDTFICSSCENLKVEKAG